MKKVTPAETPDAYVEALDGWRRELVQWLRTTVRDSSVAVTLRRDSAIDVVKSRWQRCWRELGSKGLCTLF